MASTSSKWIIDQHPSVTRAQTVKPAPTVRQGGPNVSRAQRKRLLWQIRAAVSGKG